jgi:hypothetical protein
VCTIKYDPNRIAFYFLWILPCGILFLITIMYIVRTQWYLRSLRSNQFSNKQIMANTIHKIPMWSFIIYTADIVLTSVPIPSLDGFWGGFLDTFQNIPFCMPIPILIAICRYNRYRRHVLHGRDLSGSLLGTDEALSISARRSSESIPIT